MAISQPFAATIDRLQTYDVAATAKILSLGADAVRNLIAQGVLPASNVAATTGKARWRITAGDIAEFLASRRNAPPAKPSPRRQKLPTVNQYV